MLLHVALLHALQGEPIRVAVDARDAARGIFHVEEHIPDGSVLKYPKWIPGEHGPSGPVFDVINIHVHRGGREGEWRHDPLDLYTIYVSGSGPVDLSFDYFAPRHNVATRNLARIKWNRLIMLPASNADTVVAASLRPPDGWATACALDFGGAGKLEIVTAERLIDSPAVIGRYHHTYRLESGGLPPAALEVFTEKPAELPQSAIDGHKRLYREANTFFGGPHFRHYQFLLTFSDQGAGEGLEHNECSEDGLAFDALKNDVAIADLDAHEFSHSWCGKFRRPIGLGNLNFDAPMNDQDLWVYEGFTQFAGVVLAARSKMWTIEQLQDRIASDIDWEETMAGRSWRTVEDTAIFGSLINTLPDAWISRRRGSDYYTEMVSNWLEADSIIRRESGGKKSIDDFCHAFFGGNNKGPQIVTYTRDDLIATLNRVQPYDWRNFLQTRVFSIRPHVNDGWLEKLGWSFTPSDEPNVFMKANQVGERKEVSYLNSIGIFVQDGEIRDVREGSAAEKAKLAPGMKIVAANGQKFTIDSFEDVLHSHRPIDLVVDDYDFVHTIHVDYAGGLRAPHLRRLDSIPDLLAPVVTPHAGS